MPLTVLPVKGPDIPNCIALRASVLGSLVIGRPPADAAYMTAAETALHVDLVHHHDYIHHLKVVDTDDEESKIVAYAKWEVYEHGRPDMHMLKDWKQAVERTDEDGVFKEVASDDKYIGLRRLAAEYFAETNMKIGESPHLLDFKLGQFGLEDERMTSMVWKVEGEASEAERGGGKHGNGGVR
ncbi:hypothetical protein N0V90_005538 [Kalmusia sp. IMI 367209]|nr:hypothetical protein N0V90_005538 [Kalmusia sp. IMI 367209]